MVVLTLDKPQLIIPLIGRLAGQRRAFEEQGLIFEILVGDTGSTDPEVLAAYREWSPGVTVVRDLTYHFSRCNNRVAAEATAELVLFLNNDVLLPERADALLDLHRRMARDPATGVMGAVLWFQDGGLQHAGVDFFRESPLRAFPFHGHAREVMSPDELPAIFDAPAVTGSFLTIRRPLFDEVGGFCTDYVSEAQDIDLCLKAHRAGYRTRVCTLGKTVHLENATRPKGEESLPDRCLFLRRWRSYVEAHFL